MLPSTGYFKAINCPFYESGTCDRPYCHFKHSKREDVGITTETSGTLESRPTGQVQESKSTIVQSDSDVLQQLVTEAVKKVLANQEVTGADQFSCQNVVSQVVEGLKPSLASGPSGTLEIVAASNIEKRADVPPPVSKPVPCVYNPTPIAELRKRHIPIVSYMPTRESRVAVKRKNSPDGVKPWLGIACESAESQTTEAKYKPTTIVNSNVRDTMHSYIPTSKCDPVSSNSYDDGSSSEYLLKLREPYYPKVKKRREEYVPKKVKAPLKTVKNLNDLTLDGFVSNFDMVNDVSNDAQPVSNAQSVEEPLESCLEVEPKFSDDEEDNIDARDKTEEYSHDINKVNGEFVENANTKRSEFYNDLDSDPLNDAQETRVHSPKRNISDECKANDDRKISMDTSSIPTQAKSTTKETSKSQRHEKGKTLEVDANKAKHAKEHKSRNKKKSKDQRSHDTSHKRNRDSRLSNEKSHSTSDSRSKDKSRSRQESKDSKSKKHKDKSRDVDHEKHRDKEKSRDKNGNKHKSKRDRRDSRELEKRREHNSKYSSENSKKLEHVKKRRDESKRSKSDHKSIDKSIERLHLHTENSEERNSTDRSMSPLESIRSHVDDYAGDDNDDCYISSINNYIDDIVSIASDSDHDVQEECLKIFQEYQVSERSKTVSIKEPIPEIEQTEDTGRKRVAHPSAATCVTRQVTVNQSSKKSTNPQLKMYERWRLMRETLAEKTAPASSSAPIPKEVRRSDIEATRVMQHNNELKLNGNGRVRIAHVPYAKSLAIEKKKMTESVGKASETKATDNKTAAQTAKSGVRVAHIPQTVPQLIRPEPLQVTNQKFPLNVRQYYVNMMQDVCVQIYTNSEDAAQRAVKEEFACHERCKALAVYKNSCMLATHRLRKEVGQNQSLDGSTAMTIPGSNMVSHEAVLAGKAKGSWSVLKTKKSVTQFRGAMLYGMLKKWIMSEQQLRDNGFPRPHPDGQKGRAKIYVINSRNQSALSKVPNERICSRCGQGYMIDKQGFAVRAQNCIYHWGRKFTIRGEGKYSCCQQYGSATGCCDAKTHVWEYTDYENLRGYVKTLPKDTAAEEQGVYALDCEMSYTTQGLELTRVTVIDEDCNVVYETLVKPPNPIIDFNTRFSGITEESMKDVTTSLLDVQASLLTMFSDKTILVGHSLESDFKALRLLHDTVVDTSIMFPHKNGYPQKRALKNLCSEYLRKIIQNDVGGHDSKEDAVACMELILWKAKEEAKLQ
ncbi:RNA exonuclease 1 homolog isoform X1 [Hylaeus anthracinus]|uniref:RNA exonuclease 1 homolog isoform X1 n=1 Tax=Hylaeus anthracinus TaxID=313031 RepID=UPI0023B9159E|nr:RNA exonuclease 1 homolog isoform X1 [Hylaeus anthracinus]